MTEDEYNARADKIRESIALHLMTREEENRFATVFEATRAALRYVRENAIGLLDPETVGLNDCEIPNKHARSAALNLIACLNVEIVNLSAGLEQINKLVEDWPDWKLVTSGEIA